MAGNLKIDLPPMNGEFFAGVAQLSDQGLPIDKKLQLHPGEDIHTVGVLSAAATIKHMTWNGVEAGLRILATAVFALIQAGYIGFIGARDSKDSGRTRGSDFVDYGGPEIKQGDVDHVLNLIDKDLAGTVYTVFLATKYNWWVTNHHVGQGGNSPYIQKILGITLRSEPLNIPEREATEIAHTIGHWGSTHLALRHLGIHTPRLYRPIGPANVTISLAEDLKIRQGSWPAGTARWALPAAAAKKWGSMRIFAACPTINHLIRNVSFIENLEAGCAAFQNAFQRLIGKVETAKPDTLQNALRMAALCDPKVPYHVGADFLTGRTGSRIIIDIPDGLGVIGPVAYYLFPRHTISNSPHICRNAGTTKTIAYDSSESYDQGWEQGVQGYAAAATTLKPDALAKLSTFEELGVMNDQGYLTYRLLLGADLSQAASDLLQIKKSLEEVDKDTKLPEQIPNISKELLLFNHSLVMLADGQQLTRFMTPGTGGAYKHAHQVASNFKDKETVIEDLGDVSTILGIAPDQVEKFLTDYEIDDEITANELISLGIEPEVDEDASAMIMAPKDNALATLKDFTFEEPKKGAGKKK
jgi:hypothetical protein